MKEPLSRLSRLAKVLGVLLLFYFICRLLFYFIYKSNFSEVAFGELVSLFFFGIRFDLAAIFITNFLFIFLFLLPYDLRDKKWYRVILFISFFVPNAIALAANCADLAYFGFTHKRTTFDVFTFMGKELELGKLFLLFLADFWYVFVAWILLCWGLIFFYKRINKEIPAVKNSLKTISVSFVLLLLSAGISFLAFRGGLQVIPIYNATAGEYTTANNVPLVLNSAFSIIKTSDQPPISEFRFMSDEEAAQLVNPIKPKTNDTLRKKNVVLIILESYSKEYVGYFNNGFGYTPFLDSLIGHSLVFENAFSNGRNSSEGVPSVVSGIPSLTDQPYLTSVYGSNEINSLAGILKTEGYSTAFFHGGNNGTMGFSGFTGLAGFEKYFGRNEYGNDNDFDGQWGIWDEPFLQYFAKQLNTMRQPFATAVFTLSSHHPFKVPGKYRNKFKKGAHPIMESVAYTDHALKNFFNEAKKTSWYNNTLFVITADHTGPPVKSFYVKDVGVFSIPLVFFDPGAKLQGKNKRVTQQIDIMPGVLDYLGYPGPYFSFGESPLDTSAAGWAINYNNNNYQLITREHVLQFNGKNTTAFYKWRTDSLMDHNLVKENLPEREQMEKKLKAFMQVYSEALRNNKMKSRP
jgi:phosphoglycerol transferase MdoB-like AlkP superfamily enzyme